MQIELRDVGKRFGRVQALQAITLSLPACARVALIGPNGSGKSTLTRILMGIVAAEGEVRIGGLSPFAHRRRLAQRLAYVPQAVPNFGASVGELVRAVACARAMQPARVAACAERLGLEFAAVARRPFRDLSGGMKQKLLIALALSVDAGLILMDEPTAGLDPEARQRFFHLWDEFPTGATLVLCSHRLEELQQLVDRVVVLADGRVSYEGALDGFLGRRATSIVEVRTTSDARRRWLRARGFVAGTANWWSKTVDRASKEAEVALLARELRGDLADLLIRDVETVCPGGAPEDDHAA